jgi:hypothetical protein
LRIAWLGAAVHGGQQLRIERDEVGRHDGSTCNAGTNAHRARRSAIRDPRSSTFATQCTDVTANSVCRWQMEAP